MRTVLVTGTGGAGRTTVAAATALAAAREGQRTLLLTADPDGTPEALLGIRALRFAPGRSADRLPWSVPVELAPGVWAARIITDEWFRSELTALQDRGHGLLDLLGATPLDGEELTALPGVESLALLRALRAARTAPPGTGWDVLVVDMPPAPDTVALLALPQQLRRYLRRLLPAERQAARALRPMLAQLAGVPMPAQKLYETAERWERELAAVQGVIESEATTVRLVVEPGPLADRALRTARAGLALHGCRVEAVIANRLLPTGSSDSWLAALSGQQQDALKELYEQWAPAVPVRELPHLGRDPHGVGDPRGAEPRPGEGGGAGADGVDARRAPAGLAALAGAVGAPAARPDRPAPDPWTVEDRLADDGVLLWRLPLPGADRDGLGLVRRGDELIVSVGPFHRVLPLPSALRRCTVSGAGLRDGWLQVRFTPDPDLWPKRL
ncbi:ArsA family ATPase [Streptomyces violaceusniger]|uniref:Anion-transporting ATPase n=2 Tax=Streptomyces TaxID=1883 RepID=G2P6Q8_STRV4|nr:ArsA-related P-loop ATPase [Streptomyces violaceusniger]AEM86578.1 Anion-transporting ATPase [Streptomyces violaceusniger Tu 4113]